MKPRTMYLLHSERLLRLPFRCCCAPHKCAQLQLQLAPGKLVIFRDSMQP